MLELIKPITIFLVTAFVILWVLLKKFDLLDAIVFFFPFKALFANLFLMMWYYQMLIFVVLIQMLLFKKWKNIKLNTWLIVFILYTVTSTVIISNFFIPNWIDNEFGGFFRTNGRYISTLIKIAIFQVSIIVVFHNMIKSHEKIKRLIQIYLNALVVLCVIGIIQFLFYAATGVDIYPIDVKADGTARSGVTDLLSSALPFVRISAIGGEPKGLAASLSIGIVILILGKKFGYNLIKKQKSVLALFFVIWFLTLSSGGYMLIALFGVLLFLLNVIKKEIRIKVNWKSSLFAFLLLATVVRFSGALYNVLDARILGRIDSLASEEADGIIKLFLEDQPKWIIFGSGSGNIHNLAAPYMPEKYKHYLVDNIFVSRYGYLRIISENGLVGFFLFLLFIFTIVYKTNRLSKNNRIDMFWLYLTLTAVLFYMFRAGYVVNEMYFILGLALAYYTLRKEEKMALR